MRLPDNDQKTFKRERADLLMLIYGLLVLTGVAAWFFDAKNADTLLDFIGSLFFPIIAFYTAAYGLDAVAKQMRPYDEPPRRRRRW